MKPKTTAYVARHQKLIKDCGLAKMYNCVDCGFGAHEWSHIHDSDWEHDESFQPRCRSCHRRYDHRPFNHTEETKTRLSQLMKSRHPMPEVYAKISITNQGHVVSDETRKKQSKALLGRKRTSEQIDRMKVAQRKRREDEHAAKS